ncbi:MAG: hypothetical protein E5W69_00905, partial [Mesorhizobium sp.]
VIDLRHASPKHLIPPGTAAGTVVQALRHLGPSRAADVVQIASRQLSLSDSQGSNTQPLPLVARQRTTTKCAVCNSCAYRHDLALPHLSD